ncbi:MAG: Ankyrin repeat [Alphaproteobacteria bacterium]|jgi:ankyrin repeat protein|nr:Ankyrin repeat [Alphaproteobacteria bacterium]
MNLSNVFNTNSSGETALMHAVKNGNIDVAKKLLDMGGDINIFPAIPPAATTPADPSPKKPKPSPSAKDVTEMATTRQMKAPQTARFKKKAPPKRKTTL